MWGIKVFHAAGSRSDTGTATHHTGYTAPPAATCGPRVPPQGNALSSLPPGVCRLPASLHVNHISGPQVLPLAAMPYANLSPLVPAIPVVAQTSSSSPYPPPRRTLSGKASPQPSRRQGTRHVGFRHSTFALKDGPLHQRHHCSHYTTPV